MKLHYVTTAISVILFSCSSNEIKQEKQKSFKPVFNSSSEEVIEELKEASIEDTISVLPKKEIDWSQYDLNSASEPQEKAYKKREEENAEKTKDFLLGH